MRKLTVAVSFGLLVAGAQALYSGSASGDDTFIFMRYVDNFLRGRGYCFNPGERVLGVTSPLWAFVMTPIASALGNTEAVWKAVSAALVGARASILILLLLAVGLRAGMAAVVALVAIADPHAIRWGGSGMENSLALLLLTVAVLQYWRAVQQPTSTRYLQLGLTCGLLPFARPEYSVFVGVLAVATLLRVREPRAVATCLGGGLLIGSLAAAMTWLEFGGFVPQTAAAKALLLSQADPLYASKTVLRILASGAGPAALALVLTWRRVKALGGLAISVVALAVVTSGYLAIQNQLISTRYSVVLSAPLVMLAAVVGSFVWLESPGLRRHLVLFGGAQALVAVVMCMYLFSATRTSEAWEIERVATDLRQRSDSSARVALSEIGAVGFFSDRHIVDLVGLVDEGTVEWARRNGKPASSQANLEKFLLDRRVTHYVETFGGVHPIKGVAIDFEVLGEYRVARNNLSRGEIKQDAWRIYRVRARKPGDAADVPSHGSRSPKE